MKFNQAQKLYIQRLLKKEREKIVKMIESKMINKQIITMDESGYNMALDDIIKEIKKL